MIDVRGRHVLVVGLGLHGVAAANFLVGKGARVTVSDHGSSAELGEYIEQLHGEGVDVETGSHDPLTFERADLIVLSPGVPSSMELLQRARNRGIEVISEIELGYHFCPVPIVAVTGTNGKTTTTTLLQTVVAAGGLRCVAAGNNFVPLTQALADRPDTECIVMEISSFQLETIKRFRPRIGVLLNISPDHLDRHGSVEQYAAVKKRLFANQRAGDFAVLNRDDQLTCGTWKRTKATAFFFSRKHRVQRGTFVVGRDIYFREKGNPEKLLSLSDIRLPGSHNVENVLAIACAYRLLDLPTGKLAPAVSAFSGLEHRIETVREKDGVLYVNDSKATNVGAVQRSLRAFRRPVVLIAGGRGKNADYRILRNLVKRKVKALVLLGEDASLIRSALGDLASAYEVSSIEEAVKQSSALAEDGDCVLLSPACASFDMFENFEERGKVYKDAVMRL